ncbi:hypothetical protein ACFVR1_06045 [Psychrobacillus sp. NPDC058041]|uniref:hypothetical protein n=1 Tax=Psychrobacillus sp. NPDC058041 TaxID=3346310 RepID=UPI0036D8695C
MEKVKMYKVSWFFILLTMIMGIFPLCLFLDIKEVISNIFPSIIVLIVSFGFLGYSIYLLRKRIEGKGFYWDDEGVVIDLEGNKVYWEEIENIKYRNFNDIKATVIYPHYTNHEKIRIRRKKWMPTTAHSIEWCLIEKPKEYNKNLMEFWNEKRK